MKLALEQWSDEALADEAREGSSACFDLLARRYQSPLLGFLLRSLKRPDAEDVLQEAFIQIYTHLDRYNSRYRFKTWAFVITRRLMIDRLRLIKRTPLAVSQEDIATQSSPSDTLLKSEEAHRIWSIARSSLGEEPFQALWLHYAEDMNTHEIARIMKRSWVWVKTTLFRARKKLQPHLESHQPSISSLSLSIKTGEPCQ